MKIGSKIWYPGGARCTITMRGGVCEFGIGLAGTRNSGLSIEINLSIGGSG